MVRFLHWIFLYRSLKNVSGVNLLHASGDPVWYFLCLVVFLGNLMSLCWIQLSEVQINGCSKTLVSPGRQHGATTCGTHTLLRTSDIATCFAYFSNVSACKKIQDLRWQGNTCKHWMTDGGVPKVPMQFMKFLFMSSLQWVCPESCKASGFQGKHGWLVGRVSDIATDLNIFDFYLLGGGLWQICE
jgi:hypothetical protein